MILGCGELLTAIFPDSGGDRYHSIGFRQIKLCYIVSCNQFLFDAYLDFDTSLGGILVLTESTFTYYGYFSLKS